MQSLKIITAAAFGLAVIGSGMLRYFGQDGGETGLWFGIVMGTVSLIAAVCFYYEKRVIAQVLVWAAVLFVGGWFGYEALIKKGFAQSETRQLVVIAISIVAAVILVLPGDSNTRK